MPDPVNQDEIVRLKEGTVTIFARGRGVEVFVSRDRSGEGKGEQDCSDVNLCHWRVVESLSPSAPVDRTVLCSSLAIGWGVYIFSKPGARLVGKLFEAMDG